MAVHPAGPDSTTFVETYLSNFGLLEALQAISGSQLAPPVSSPGNPNPTMGVSPDDAAADLISQLSWSTMIPAVFHWSEATPLYTLPAADGRTTVLSNTSISLNGPQNQNGPDGAYDLVAGHFTPGDTNLDLAVADYSSSEVSILQGNGDVTFTSVWPPASLGGPDYPEGIAAGQFLNDNGLDDLAVTTNSHVVALINQGNGQFNPNPAINLETARGQPAAADRRGRLLQQRKPGSGRHQPRHQPGEHPEGGRPGNFSLVQNVDTGLLRPWGIATGDFDQRHGGAGVAYQWSDAVGILKVNGNGQFAGVHDPATRQQR